MNTLCLDPSTFGVMTGYLEAFFSSSMQILGQYFDKEMTIPKRAPVHHSRCHSTPDRVRVATKNRREAINNTSWPKKLQIRIQLHILNRTSPYNFLAFAAENACRTNDYNNGKHTTPKYGLMKHTFKSCFCAGHEGIE